ncbi:MAG TPA: penicillin-binding protein [Alphaproteobacteria bacterium]|nr:penicillin-binding protein [Alphaproteobacteria bacterium]
MARAVKLNISLEGALNKAVEKSKFRVFLILPIIILTFLAIAIKTTILCTQNISERLLSDNVSQVPNILHQVSLAPSKAIRKNIYDRNGILIASSLVTSSLFAHPNEMIEKDYAAELVHKVLPELSVAYLKEKFFSEKKFQWIKRNLTPKQKYAVNSLGIPGLYFEAETKRIYPHKELFSHVIGSVGVDSQGLSGMEKVIDSLNKHVTDNEVRDYINTTMDVRIQNIVHEELSSQMEKHKAVAAAGIVMDATNGEIISLVSLPDYEPNFLKSITPESFFNHATLGVYELGSVFKPITFAAAFEKNLIKMNSKFDATQALKIGRFRISDFHPENRWLTTPEVMMHSSNIGTAKIGEIVGINGFKDIYRKLGFYERSGIEIQEKASSNIPNNWGQTTLFTASYGHGLAITPMHLIAGYMPIVNGGVLYKPTLIKEEKDPEGKEVFSKSTSDIMRKLLRLVVARGTATKANISGFLVGGKTGTAEKIDENGRYSKTSKVTTFVGAFPMNKPKYLVLTLFDDPKPSKDSYGYATAGWVAAPAAGKIISRMAPILKIMPQDENDEKIKAELEITGVDIR